MPPTSPSPLTLSDGTQLDPKVVKVMQTIRQIESKGNYTASGDNGSSYGAYQWNNDNKPLKPGELPSHWKNAAQKILGDSNAPMTPANQNKVAYAQIAEYKAQGLQPDEIDALWNGAHKEGDKYVHNNPKRAQEFQQALTGQQQAQQPAYGYVQPPTLHPTGPQTPDSTGGAPTVDPAVFNEQQPQQPGGLMGLLQGASGVLAGAEKPFFGVAAIPLQAGVAGYNALTGSHVQDPFAQGVPGGLPGVSQNTSVTPLNLEQKAGDVAQVGSYFVPGAEGLGGVAGATGAGLLQGAGTALSNKGSLADVAVGGALGAGTGGILGAGAGLAGAALRGVGDTVSGKAAQTAQQGIHDAYSSALNLNASERGFEGRSGKDLANVLMENRAPLGRHENGTVDATGAIAKLQEVLKPLNEEAHAFTAHPSINTDEKAFVPIEAVRHELLERIKGANLDPLEEEQSLARANKLMDAAQRKYGERMLPIVAEKFKQTLQSTAFKKALTSSDALRGNVSYLASDVMKNRLEGAVAHVPGGDKYRALNAKRSDLIDAIKRLTKLDGVRTVKGGRLGNMMGGVVGSIAGAASGLGGLGALAGDYFGSKAAEFLQNPATKIGTAEAKARALGAIPKMAGAAGRKMGASIAATGKASGKLIRPAGLLGNLIGSNNVPTSLPSH